MEKVFENNYLIFEMDKTKSIFLYTWKPTSEELENEKFFLEAKRILEGILASECDYIIGNDTEFYVSITPDVQELINEQMLQQLNNRIKKFVHIVSKEFMARLSVEQLFEENNAATYEDLFVDTIDEGIKLAS